MQIESLYLMEMKSVVNLKSSCLQIVLILKVFFKRTNAVYAKKCISSLHLRISIFVLKRVLHDYQSYFHTCTYVVLTPLIKINDLFKEISMNCHGIIFSNIKKFLVVLVPLI